MPEGLSEKRLERYFTGESKGIYTGPSKMFVKVFNQLRASEAGRYRDLTKGEALALAAYFTELRKRRFFHPDSRFAVIQSHGAPTVVAIMPKLRDELPRVPPSKVYLPMDILDEQGIHDAEPHFDVALRRNWGIGDDGGHYCLDLHVLTNSSMDRVFQWHKRVRAAGINKKKGAIRP